MENSFNRTVNYKNPKYYISVGKKVSKQQINNWQIQLTPPARMLISLEFLVRRSFRKNLLHYFGKTGMHKNNS